MCKKGGKLFIATPYPCERQILTGDEDHYFVLSQMQMKRLLISTGWQDIDTFTQNRDIELEQSWNVISIGEKR